MYILGSGAAHAQALYSIIFIVVLISVVLQGGLLPNRASAFRVPMRRVEQRPWTLGMRFSDEPHGLHRFTVAEGSAADGATIADLALGEDGWISMVRRDGHLIQVRGSTQLRAGDWVLALSEAADAIADLFKPLP